MVGLVRRFVEMGYKVIDVCKSLGISRSIYYRKKREGGERRDKKRRVRRDELEIIERIKELKTTHPFWGYRRIHAWLVHREGKRINIKRVRRIMKEQGLEVKRKEYKAKRREEKGSKPKAERPRQYWGIDMTKFFLNGVGWIYLIVILDWYSKKVVGWNVSLRCKTVDWLKAVEEAVLNEFPEGSRGKGLSLISDNGCQPTSQSFLKVLSILSINQILTSYNNPRGNADTERFMRTIKEELLWLNEFGSFEEAKRVIGEWMKWYNTKYVHSSLGYLSPEEYERRYNAQQNNIAA